MQTISKQINFEYFIVISSMVDGQVPIPLPLDPPLGNNYVSSALRSGIARLPLSFHKVKYVTFYVLSYLQVSGMFCPIKK